MPPKRTSQSSSSTPKRQKKVMTLNEKVELLNKCREGLSFAAVGRLYHVNESTVRYIKKNEDSIRAAVTASAPRSAKYALQVRDKSIIKMENALFLWLEDQHRKSVAVDSNVIREKAKSLYQRFKTPATLDEPGPSTSTTPSTASPTSEFQASRGWFQKFKRRFSLKNVKITGESASADHVAAEAFPSELKAIIQEKGYKPEQVWNMDETGLFWKKMPQRTFIAQEERRAPGFKAAKDRCSVLFCGNAAGHLIRPGFIYKAANPRALQRRNKNLLPVYWMHNKKAWTTSDLFLDWFHHCFLPEVERYLQQEGIEFKVLLTLDNAPRHPQSVQVLHDDVQVVFFPPNTTSLIQPMDMGIIKAFKAHYGKRVMARLHSAMDRDPNMEVMQYWKSFTIADCLSVVEESFSDIKPQTVNACWKSVWPDCVKDFKGFAPGDTVSDAVRKTLALAQKVAAEGFHDMDEEDVMELLEGHDTELIEEDLEELVRSASEEEEDEEAEAESEEQGITLDKLGEMSRQLEALKNNAYSMDPSMVRALKFMRGLDDVFSPYKNIMEEMKRQKRQLPITMFFSRQRRETTTDTPAQPPSTPSISSGDDLDDPPPIAENSSDDGIEAAEGSGEMSTHE